MRQFEYTIEEASGIHARPAGMLVKTAGKYKSNIILIKNEKHAVMKGLFGIMELGVRCGDTIIVQADGEDEDEAIKEIKEIFDANL